MYMLEHMCASTYVRSYIRNRWKSNGEYVKRLKENQVNIRGDKDDCEDVYDEDNDVNNRPLLAWVIFGLA